MLDCVVAKSYLQKRHRIIRRCRWSKGGAGIFLVLGVIAMGVATLKPLLIDKPTPPPQVQAPLPSAK
jgi:hypothetical protein